MWRHRAIGGDLSPVKIGPVSSLHALVFFFARFVTFPLMASDKFRRFKTKLLRVVLRFSLARLGLRTRWCNTCLRCLRRARYCWLKSANKTEKVNAVGFVDFCVPHTALDLTPLSTCCGSLPTICILWIPVTSCVTCVKCNCRFAFHLIKAANYDAVIKMSDFEVFSVKNGPIINR